MPSDQMQRLTLWSTIAGPNPWKVAFVLEELDISYDTKLIDFPDMKKPPFEKININGRVPALQDPNTGITLWESGAIIEYLVETYDKTNKISFASGTVDYFHAKQWLHFQMSGQGPYFGQAIWFDRYHPEQVETAKDRYVNEIRRVCGVLNRALEGSEYLVGGKYSYADVAFLPWFILAFFPWYNMAVPGVFAHKVQVAEEFPNVAAWLTRMRERPAISKVLEKRASQMK